jgi:glycosyltransferase involved in cell wall biosynthesis
MATYNGERYLEGQLASIGAQTLAPSELVVCDDGSTDATLAILEAFSRRSSFPVRIHRNETRLGFADNFLTAAALCQSEKIAFSDQDDVWAVDKLERCAAAFTDGVVLVVHTCELVDETLRPLGRVFPRIRRGFVAEPLESDQWFHMPGMAMLFAAELLQVADWHRRPRSHFEPGGSVYHDEWIHVLAQVCGKIAFLPDTLSQYRQHGINVTGAPGPPLIERSREAMTVGLAYYSDRAIQAQEWCELFTGLAKSEEDPFRRARYERGAAFFVALARRLRLRVSVYAPERRAQRLLALSRVLAVRGYGRRRRGGFGLRGLMRDIVMLGLGRR